MRRRAVYLIGGPGTGKSTTVRHVLNGVRLDPPDAAGDAWPLLKVQPFRGRSGAYLGVRGGRFPGTDRLSMAVSPQAVEWALSNRVPEIVVGEGARLGTAKFLAALSSSCDLLVGHLVAAEYVTAERFAVRGSAQSDSWVAGRVTAAANAAQDLEGAGVRVLEVDTSAAGPGEVAAVFRDHLRLG
ncbi:P-loop-containing protein [Brevibacterium moorei]|uniref:P-loop-containing protein n=1 Tax=Brevibacterium moorei TaxID=2968457 RepID=UPI00211CB104|nr:P-loop-containing protein [Brevibacterium sp. 68QC2CO]MCQ9384423.1 P-loop-containing protein [Brevibacterium sp. 68QC2CO]